MYKFFNYNGQTHIQLPDGSYMYMGKIFLTISGLQGAYKFQVSNLHGETITINQQEISDYYGNTGAPFLGMAARTIMEVFIDGNMFAS